MAANWGRWWKYAQAKLNGAVSAENAELDQLEAEQRANAEGKPWLSSDGGAPTLEETKARIEWEAEEQRRKTEVASNDQPAAAAPIAPPASPTDPASSVRAANQTHTATPADPTDRSVPGAPVQPSTSAVDPKIAPDLAAIENAMEPTDPDVTRARIELDRRARESAARLDAIREELGVEPPATPDDPPPTG